MNTPKQGYTVANIELKSSEDYFDLIDLKKEEKFHLFVARDHNNKVRLALTIQYRNPKGKIKIVYANDIHGDFNTDYSLVLDLLSKCEIIKHSTTNVKARSIGEYIKTWVDIAKRDA